MPPLRDAIEILIANLVTIELSREEPGTNAVVVNGFIIRDGLTHGEAMKLAESARATIRSGIQTAVYLLRQR